MRTSPNQKKVQFNRHSVGWLVGRLHVMEPTFAAARLIVSRTKGWPRKQRILALECAVKAHLDNRQLYLDVMGGRF